MKSHKLTFGGNSVAFQKSPNVGGALNAQFLVIHYTASGPSSDIAKYFTNASAKVSAHVVIRRDGTVIQCVPFNVQAWHAGKSTWIDRNGNSHVGLNRSSIGIEIENWGPLKRTAAGWVSWIGQAVDSSLVIEARHKFGVPNGGWEVFTEAQIAATIAVSQAICAAYDIAEIVGHDDIAPGRKSDPGPAWKMDSFKAKVFGREENGPVAMAVRSSSGLNVRSGPAATYPLVTNGEPNPLPDGTLVVVLEADGSWRFVSVLDADSKPKFSGWVHGGYLGEV